MFLNRKQKRKSRSSIGLNGLSVGLIVWSQTGLKLKIVPSDEAPLVGLAAADLAAVDRVVLAVALVVVLAVALAAIQV